MKTLLTLGLPAWLVLVLAPGCYTVIRHTAPPTAETTDDIEQEEATVDHASACLNCHEGAFDGYDYAFHPPREHVQGFDRWSDYYGYVTPWWVVYAEGPAVGDTEEEGAPLQRNYGRRRSAAQTETTATGAGTYQAAGGGQTGGGSTYVASSDTSRPHNNDTINKSGTSGKQRDYGTRRTKKK